MPRRPRSASSTGIYHVILRSVNQQQIFEDAQDYVKFLTFLKDCSNKYNARVYAYCMMSNHIHMILDCPLDNISITLQSLCGRFVLWYNKKYERYGHLFQERFWSNPICDDSQLANTIFYIHHNPVKANMCRFDTEYTWSSARTYYGASDNIIDMDGITTKLGTREAMLHYFATCNVDFLSFPHDEIYEKEKPVIDEIALDKFHSVTGCKSPSDFQKLSKTQRHEYIFMLHKEHLSYPQIARYCGISEKTAARVVQSRKQNVQ